MLTKTYTHMLTNLHAHVDQNLHTVCNIIALVAVVFVIITGFIVRVYVLIVRMLCLFCMHVCMFACVYVCMYACVYVCMCVCLHVYVCTMYTLYMLFYVHHSVQRIHVYCIHVHFFIPLKSCTSPCIYTIPQPTPSPPPSQQHADPANLSPFFGDYGWRGVFNGAAIVFFSYIGFDAICNTAEEVKNPKRDLPLGLIGSLSTVTVLYVLAALVIVMMVPYADIDGSAAFSAAFVTVGAKWASFIVAAGACVGIVTGVLVRGGGGGGGGVIVCACIVFCCVLHLTMHLKQTQCFLCIHMNTYTHKGKKNNIHIYTNTNTQTPTNTPTSDWVHDSTCTQKKGVEIHIHIHKHTYTHTHTHHRLGA